MNVAPNRVVEALERGGPAYGTWVQTTSPEACEVAAATGYDFVVIDLQHGNASISDAARMITSVRAGGASPIIRLPHTHSTEIGRLLDLGAHGVLAPDLRTGEDARRIVASTRYAPEGLRGACPTVSATAHGAVDWQGYRAWSTSQILAWGLVETVEAVENIDEIVASGLHALVLGPFDLSMAMGHDGNVGHPDVLAALDHVVTTAHAGGVDTVAVLFDQVDRIAQGARRWLAQGTRILTATSDRWCLGQGMGQGLAGLREAYR